MKEEMAVKTMQVKSLEIVLKITERCNIDCTYCYFFNDPQQLFSKHTPVISVATIDALCTFLLQAINKNGIEQLRIDFHGGEPLLMKPGRFESMCTVIREKIGKKVNLEFALQTNAMLVTEEWIKIFEKHSVSVSISLDGPKDINDLNRIDKKRHGTYDRVISGYRLLQKAAIEGRLPQAPAILCVINPQYDAKRIYRHFVDDLGAKRMAFLLPDTSHNTFNILVRGKYFPYLRDIYDEWTNDVGNGVAERLTGSIMFSLLKESSDNYFGVFEYGNKESEVITISSNGGIGPDDILRGIDVPLFDLYNIEKDTLTDFLLSETSLYLKNQQASLPSKCKECVWRHPCKGGYMFNRYKKGEEFTRPSVYCKDIKNIFSHISAHLIRSGVPSVKIESALGFGYVEN